MKNIIFILLVTFFSKISSAYIPPYWMIMSRVAENHGQGPHRISQDVTFYHGADPIVVTETWTVVSEKEMRLDVRGKGHLKDALLFSYVYDDQRRFYLDSNLRRQSVAAPKENPDVFFNFKFSKNIKPLLVQLKMAPSESLKSEPLRFNPKTPTSMEENFVRLARSGGVVTYALGTPSTDDTLYPGIWIEQDQFVIRKIRLRPDYEVVASQYKSFGKGYKLPLLREINWKGRSVRISLTGATSLSAGPKLKEYVSPKGLLGSSEKEVTAPLWPDDNVIREFYTELR